MTVSTSYVFFGFNNYTEEMSMASVSYFIFLIYLSSALLLNPKNLGHKLSKLLYVIVLCSSFCIGNSHRVFRSTLTFPDRCLLQVCKCP